jgi:homoserine kinase type II
MKEDVVYELWYKREYANREDTELRIGIYRSQNDAQKVIEELREKPGFKEWPDGFQILSTTLNRGCFLDGFKTTYGPPPKDATAEAFDLPYWVETGES